MPVGRASTLLVLPCVVASCGIASAQDSAPTTGAIATTADATAPTMMLASVTLNGRLLPGDYLLARRAGAFLVRVKDLAAWRMRPPTGTAMMIDGDAFVALSSLGGVAAAFDEPSQALLLTVSPEAFEATSVAPASTVAAPSDNILAAFLNYDISAEYAGKARLGAFVEAGLSDDWGVVSNSMLLGNGTVYGRATRLDSYYLRDDPINLTRLVIGDGVTDARDWTRQIRFGGVRFGTEFALQPSLLTFPTPSLAGSAAVPSNVELLVNGTQRFQTDVGQGPFSINQVPLVTGAGQVTLVIRDPLGVERRVTSSYYVSSHLLRAGLASWSMEAGAERRGYGLRSFGYDNPFLAGTYRRGLTDRLTIEGRAEASANVTMAGGGVNMIIVPIGEISLAAAGSTSQAGEGLLYRAAFARNAPTWNVALSYQRASNRYREIGVERDSERIVEQVQGSAGWSLGTMGTIGASYTSLTYADSQSARVLSGNYSLSLRDKAFVSAYAIRSRFSESGHENSIGFNLTIPFGPRSSAYLQADRGGVRAEMRSTPPQSGGWGYRAAISTGSNAQQQGEILWRGNAAEMTAQVDRAGGQTGWRVTGQGGLLLADGALFPTRRVESGFAVVRVPGQADVRIYQENRLVARTDARGMAVIPDLRPYEVNRLSIAAADVPIDIRMPNDQIRVVPRYRGAVSARFVAVREHPATLRIVMPDGAPAEIGASVTAEDEKSFVGNDGAVFIRSLHPGMILTVDTGHGPCHVRVDAVPDEMLPVIGPLTCVP